MNSRKAARPDRLELLERSMLGFALVSGVLWAVVGGTPLANGLF